MIVLVALISVGSFHAERVRVIAQNTATPESVWDGVYDAGQAARGKTQYLKECSSCHLADLTGRDQAVSLQGEAFILQWENRTVADLFAAISTTMPQGGAGQLSSRAYIDIVAFLLQANEFPPGSKELPRDADGLKGIRILRRKE
jgi:mono/diheme cytochrome c family protein